MTEDGETPRQRRLAFPNSSRQMWQRARNALPVLRAKRKREAPAKPPRTNFGDGRPFEEPRETLTTLVIRTVFSTCCARPPATRGWLRTQDTSDVEAIRWHRKQPHRIRQIFCCQEWQHRGPHGPLQREIGVDERSMGAHDFCGGLCLCLFFDC